MIGNLLLPSEVDKAKHTGERLLTVQSHCIYRELYPGAHTAKGIFLQNNIRVFTIHKPPHRYAV